MSFVSLSDMFRVRRLRAAILLIVFCTLSLSAFARNGSLISLRYERSFSPAEIRDFISTLYSGYKLPEITHHVDVYQIQFTSSFANGSEANAFAQVFLPRFTPEEPDLRNLYVFAPGSTGLIDNCRASREHEAGIRWGLYRAHVLSHAGAGSIAIQPDYLGFRDPAQYQQYMIADAEAAVLLDSIRVMQQVYERVGYDSVLATVNVAGGFSQGGHAILAAADRRAEYSPELSLHGVIGYGATADPLKLMLEYPSVAPMIIYTYWQYYGSSLINPGRILRGEYAEFLEDDVLSQCVGAMSSYYPSDPARLYTADFYQALVSGNVATEFPGIYQITRENRTGLRNHESRVLLLQGTDDIVIYPETQRAYYEQLLSRGIQAELSIFTGARHDTRQVGYESARQWMHELMESMRFEILNEQTLEE